MKIGLFTPLRSPVATPEFLKDFGQKAEEIGIHSVWLGEHVVIFDKYESQYPGSSDGVFRFPDGSSGGSAPASGGQGNFANDDDDDLYS